MHKVGCMCAPGCRLRTELAGYKPETVASQTSHKETSIMAWAREQTRKWGSGRIDIRK